MIATDPNMKKDAEREALRAVIQQWNANRLDLFELSEPNEVSKIRVQTARERVNALKREVDPGPPRTWFGNGLSAAITCSVKVERNPVEHPYCLVGKKKNNCVRRRAN